MKGNNDDKIWELISGEIHNELSPDEKTELDALLIQDDNGKILNQVRKISGKLIHLKSLTDVSSAHSWGRVIKHIRIKKIRILFTVLKYAAIVILALFAGSLLKTGNTFTGDENKITEIYIPLGQMSQMTLPDGTKVWLNSGTTFSFRNNFGDKSREVNLHGEAFFKVTPDKIPFKVKLKKSEVQVLGTSFNVVSYDDENFSEVTLVEGKVKITNPAGNDVVQLKPGEQITLSDDLKNNILKVVETDFFTSWTEGKIMFEEERLADITQQLERWYNVEIRFAEKEVGNYRFSGTILKNKPFDQIVKAFSLLLPVHIQYTNNLNKKDIVLISRK